LLDYGRIRVQIIPDPDREAQNWIRNRDSKKLYVSDPELSDPDPKSDPLPQEKIVPEFKSSLYGTGLGSDQVLT
jgi:hypothetical protein